jgi:hypothetical protein
MLLLVLGVGTPLVMTVAAVVLATRPKPRGESAGESAGEGGDQPEA